MIEVLERQIEAVLRDVREAVNSTEITDLSTIPVNDLQALFTRSVAVIRRVGPSSTYSKELDRLLEPKAYVGYQLRIICGVLQGLLEDVKAGYLTSVLELVHADVAGDYLEQATTLLDSHYKDAAAVMIGAILEQRLKNLADKHGTGSLRPDQSAKPANTLNDELAAAGVYSKTEQKNVLAQLGLRNDAAHGHYSSYDEARVKLMLATVQHFLTLYPA